MRVRPILAFIAVITFSSCGDSDLDDEDPMAKINRLLEFRELKLIEAIKAEQDPAKREQMLDELEAMPVEIHRFYSRWMLLHDGNSYQAWSADGFDHTKAPIPRDIQLLAAAVYSRADINNGGFHQFFTNSTGMLAPEMVEWLERADFPDAAEVVKSAMKVFGDEYPRSQAARVEFLDKFEGETREEWDPFSHLDGPFYEDLSEGRDTFHNAADKWLREVCNIKDLRTPMPSVE